MTAPAETASADRGIITLPCSPGPRASILIPTINQAEHLAACLRSLVKSIAPETAYETILILNQASEEVRELVCERVRGVRVVESDVNLGVAGGNNLGRSVARGEYLVLLHDDTEIEPRWLESLIATADRQPEAGAVAGLSFLPDGRLTGCGWILWSNGVTSPCPELCREPRAVDYGGTCSLLVRASTWDAIGGLDENIYPAYYVDVDLCMSVRRQGQVVLVDPGSRLMHHGRSSSASERATFIAQRNREYFVEKWTAELQHHQPQPTGDPGALVAAAQERATKTAAELRLRVVTSATANRPPLDAAHQAAMHRMRETVLQQAFQIAQLERQGQETKERSAHLRTELDCVRLEAGRLRQSRDTEREKKLSRTEEAARWKSRAQELGARLKRLERALWSRIGKCLRVFPR